jgi:hypothetical protein
MIERPGQEEPSWLACWPNGEIMCFHPICATDMAEIKASEKAQ